MDTTPDGEVLVAYEFLAPDGEQRYEARLLTDTLQPTSPPVALPGRYSAKAIARTVDGNMATVWVCGTAMSRLCVRILDPSGRQIGRDSELPHPGPGTPIEAVAIVPWTGDDLLVVWSSAGLIHTRRLRWAPPGDDLCLLSGGSLWCDLGHDGGAPELRIAWRGGTDGIPLLGDLDGDGRADLCLYRDGQFACDTGHLGSITATLSLGLPGDIPLLGDVDGNGTADPCLFRSGLFLCDTAHSGEPAQVIRFGATGDIPLLGDVNGDGSADPCVVRGQRLLCDTSHQDGSTDVDLPFAVEPGDVALLGDFDDDGRSDPCVYRSGSLLCDLAHRGVFDATIRFAIPGGWPLLGNADGL